MLVSEKSALIVRSLLTLAPEPLIFNIVLKPTILYPAPMVRPDDVASTICPAPEFSVNVRWSRYSALNVRSFFSVTLAPMSGAKRSVMATDEMLNGDEGMGRPVSSSRVKPLSEPSAESQLRYEL